MSQYLIDSNAFILSARRIYRFHIFPSFWKWLKKELISKHKEIILPRCVYNELTNSPKYKDKLSKWVKQLSSYVYDERKDQRVINNLGRVFQYVDDEMIYKQGPVNDWNKDGKADPRLIAIAMTYGYTIVTNEQTSGQFILSSDLYGNPTNKLKNPSQPAGGEPKIPDVANHFGVRCVDLFQLEDELNLCI